LIHDLLQLSLISRSELQRQTVDLSTLADDIITTLRASEPARRVAVLVAPGLTVSADPGLLNAALENLLRNAWKYSSQRETARIEFGALLREGQTIFFVRDNGAGFDMANAGRLFRPFERLHSEAEFKGTGIGLTTVQRVIERHGGRIWAEAAVNQG